MDGKYAKYIPSSYGFITKLEIVGDMLHVHTKETAKKEPLKYPLKEKIAEYSGRLENQYRLITVDENAQLIKNDLVNKAKEKAKIFGSVSALAIGLSGLAALYFGLYLLVVAAVALILTSLLAHEIAETIIETKFDQEIDMVKTYLEARSDIEALREKDPNVTANLKPTTINRININDALYEEYMISEVFDITLLDDLINKKKFKEIKKLLTNYMICTALQQPQAFVDPTEEKNDSHIHGEPRRTTGKYTRGRRPNNK